MRKLFVSASILAAVSLASAQEFGGAWFIEKGKSQPVALLTLGRLDNVLGLEWLDLDLSAMIRPTDGIRLGGAITLSTPIAKNAWATFGIGGMAGDRFEWSSVRPGLVLGLTVRF